MRGIFFLWTALPCNHLSVKQYEERGHLSVCGAASTQAAVNIVFVICNGMAE